RGRHGPAPPGASALGPAGFVAPGRPPPLRPLVNQGCLTSGKARLSEARISGPAGMCSVHSGLITLFLKRYSQRYVSGGRNVPAAGRRRRPVRCGGSGETRRAPRSVRAAATAPPVRWRLRSRGAGAGPGVFRTGDQGGRELRLPLLPGHHGEGEPSAPLPAQRNAALDPASRPSTAEAEPVRDEPVRAHRHRILEGDLHSDRPRLVEPYR